ncbi:M24 family metallopeptidase [Paenibacillus thermotolerans]|uniref:M24 family metallopeptidase n=1 Tax=Paenibacillus thermotolerans TaxID=3027807 RepID=UPI0023689A03|nr:MULTISPECIES: Xaa-Pro peptidase family protein [unclassified Paenibacillus]
MTIYDSRMKHLQTALREQQLAAFIVTHNVDIYYLTGTMQSGLLLVPAAAEPTFYVRRSITRARDESAVRVEELGSLKTLGARAAERYPELSGAVPIALTYDVLPVEWFDRLRAAFPDAQWHNASAIIREARMVKDPEELEAMRKAARIADDTLRQAVRGIRPGMTEIELLADIEYMLRKAGHLGLMRVRAMNMELVTGIAASGASAAIPSAFDGPAGGEGLHSAFPKGAGFSPILPGEPILLDIGCNIEGYVTDQTRTAVIGELDEELQAAYDASEAILARIERELKPGAICEDIYEVALEMAARSGFGDHFMGYKGDAVKFVGHGIGLEIDEWPVLAKGFRTPLRPGMVVAIEPKFTFKDRGVVGIENTYAITESGFERLTLTPPGLIRL